jgi:hypothetical protein
MKEQIYALIKLQKIETESQGIEYMLGNVSRKIDSFDSKLKEVEQSVIDEESLRTELNKKYRLYESDVQAGISRIGNNETKLREVKTNREYHSLLKEIEDQKTKNSQMEDEMLLFLDRIDEIDKNIIKKKKEYSQFKEMIESDKENVRQEAEQKKGRLLILESEHKNVLESIKPELIKIYMTVKQKVHGNAIARVQDAVCSGCNMNITPQMYIELQRCDTLKFCPNCQRIIYCEQS